MAANGSNLYHEDPNLTDSVCVLETQENILWLSSNDYVEHHVDRLWLSGTRILAKRMRKIVGDCHGSPLHSDLTELSTRVYLGEEVSMN